jgi:hypothetical protein
MFQKLFLGIAVCLLFASSTPVAQQRSRGVSAWDTLLQVNPTAVDDHRIDWKERLVLYALSPQQAADYYRGADPESILLENGQTLQQFLDHKMEPDGSQYFPLPAPCTLFHFEELRSGTPVALRARGNDLSQQGGSGFGCGIPKDATAVVTQLHLRSRDAIPIRVKLWPGNRPEPAEPIFDLASGNAVYSMAIIPLDPADDFDRGEIQVTSSEWSELQGQAVGYFKPSNEGKVSVTDVSFYTESTDLDSNNYFGYLAGEYSNGDNNSYFGHEAGKGVSGVDNFGSGNAFFGWLSGEKNRGSNNTFMGREAGQNKTLGDNNTFIGANSGEKIQDGGFNSFFGAFADVCSGSSTIQNSTVIGAQACVSQSDSIVLGDGEYVGIGTAAPLALLHVKHAGSTSRIILAESTGPEAVRNMMDLKNNGMAQFRLIDTSPNGDAWQFSNTDNNLNISLQGSGSQEFVIENDGDVWINNGTVMVTSYRASKENFRELDSQEILERLAGLPLSDWNYRKDADTVRHIGPVSEDFFEVFGYGEDDQHISPNDLAGVAIAAAQGLFDQVKEKDRRIESMRLEMDLLKQEMVEMKQLLRSLTGN